MNTNFLMTAQRLENLNVEIERNVLICGSNEKFISFGSCFAQNINTYLGWYGLDSFFERSLCAHYSSTTMAQTLSRLAAKEAIPEDQIYIFQDELGGVIPTTYFAKNRTFGEDPVRVVLKNYGIRDKKVYERIADSTVFIITLGTSRVVRINATGVCASAASGISKSDYTFEQTDVETNFRNLQIVYDSIVKIKGNTKFKIIVTLSPQRYKWASDLLAGKCGFTDNCLSKSILRVAIEQFVASHNNITYFPSYEIVIDELRNYETLSGYDYLHINSDYTPRYVVKRFLLSYADESVVNQLALLDNLQGFTHTMSKDQAHNGNVKCAYYQNKLKGIIAEAEEIVGDAEWNMLLARRLYGAAVWVDAPELFMNYWTILQRRLSEKHKTFMIWGVGGRYREYYAPFVQAANFSLNFLGVVDSNAKVVGKKVDGHRVHRPEQLSKLKPDVILCASTFFKEISKQAAAICPGVHVMPSEF